MRTFILSTILILLTCTTLSAQSDIITQGGFGVELGGGYGSSNDISGSYMGLSVSLLGIVDFGYSNGSFSTKNPDGNLKTTSYSIAITGKERGKQLNQWRGGLFFEHEKGTLDPKDTNNYFEDRTLSTNALGVMLFNNLGKSPLSVVQPCFIIGVILPEKTTEKHYFVSLGLSIIIGISNTSAFRVNPSVSYTKIDRTYNTAFNISASMILGNLFRKETTPSKGKETPFSNEWKN